MFFVETACTFTAPASALSGVPVFEGTTLIRPNGITYSRNLESGQALLLKAVLTVEIDGSVDITTAGGRVFAHNAGRSQATVTVDGGRSTKLKAGAVARLK